MPDSLEEILTPDHGSLPPPGIKADGLDNPEVKKPLRFRPSILALSKIRRYQKGGAHPKENVFNFPYTNPFKLAPISPNSKTGFGEEKEDCPCRHCDEELETEEEESDVESDKEEEDDIDEEEKDILYRESLEEITEDVLEGKHWSAVGGTPERGLWIYKLELCVQNYDSDADDPDWLPSDSDTDSDAVDGDLKWVPSVNTDHIPQPADPFFFSSKLRIMMSKKARKDNKKEKNVRQVMKTEEVAGYMGNEHIDDILKRLGENPRELKRGTKRAKIPKADKKGQTSIKNDMENEEDFFKEDFLEFIEEATSETKTNEVLSCEGKVDTLNANWAKLHDAHANVLNNASFLKFVGPENKPVDAKDLKKIQIEIRRTIPVDKKKGEGSRPIFDREEIKKEVDVKAPKRGREKSPFIITNRVGRLGMIGKTTGPRRMMSPDETGREMLHGKDGASPHNHNCSDQDVRSKLDQLQIELQETKNRLREVLSIERKTNYELRAKLQESEETNNCSREDLSLEKKANGDLRAKLQESEETNNSLREDLSLERKNNDQLRAKLLKNEFLKYNEILGQSQENNQSIISHIRESPELKHIPQVQLALITLDEYSARLVLAGEELNSRYETVVQQSQSNGDITELHFDLSCLKPPNLGTNFLNLLQSFIIMSQSSSPSTPILQPPIPLNSTLPPVTYRPPSSINSPMINSRSTTIFPKEVVTPHPNPANSSQDSSQSATPANYTFQNSTGTRPKAASVVRNTKTSKRYDKLIAQLQDYHPNLSLAEANGYIFELRKSNNGKLSGMSIQDIMKKVAIFIKRDRGVSGGARTEVENCSICFEDMSAADSARLDPCCHRFHNTCINLWLESPGGAGSTCPMCRNYIVKEEEFPGLNSARRRF